MFNPRKRNRLSGFDYSKEAIYFLTTCCHERKHFFGSIVHGEMYLNKYGQIANKQLQWLMEQYSFCHIHNAVVMPNHVHILLEIRKDDSTEIKINSVSNLMGAYKTTVSKQIHLAGKENFRWQRSFHDHIVRNDVAYEKIFSYINNNPKNWKLDKFKTDE